MKRLLAASFAVIATVSSLLIATPAQASTKLEIVSKHIATSSSGTGKVWVRCNAKKDCSGKIWVTGASKDANNFKMKAKKKGYVTLKYPAWKDLPTDARGFRHVTINATGAKAIAARLEPTKRATISGTVQALSGPTITDVEVQLWRVDPRQRLVSIDKVTPASDGKYSFSVPTGNNNSATAKYRVQIIGKQAGNRRTWWWRGSNGNFTGGAMHSGRSTAFAVTRNSADLFQYVADFKYSSISGNVTSGGNPASSREVTVYARPTSWPTTGAGMRDLDVTSCADIVGRTKTNSSGNYNLGFVPVTSNRVYIVKTEKSWWNGEYGTCHAAVNFRRAADGASTPGLSAVSAATTVKNISEDRNGTKLTVKVSGYQGPASTAKVDKWVTIREYAPGRKILSSDVVYQGTSRSHNLGAGTYWVETGRRLGCQAWYDSRFKDNSGYFKGLDRGHESKKAKNYRMYREHCRAYSTGAYELVKVNGTGSASVTLKNKKGGTVKGKLTGPTKKTRVEVLIRLTSTDGKLVYRTAMTNGSGNFSVTGLAPGKYKVQVNSDSWRGIKRGFTGKKTVTVKAGKTHSIGTLKFKG